MDNLSVSLLLQNHSNQPSHTNKSPSRSPRHRRPSEERRISHPRRRRRKPTHHIRRPRKLITKRHDARVQRARHARTKLLRGALRALRYFRHDRGGELLRALQLLLKSLRDLRSGTGLDDQLFLGCGIGYSRLNGCRELRDRRLELRCIREGDTGGLGDLLGALHDCLC